MRTVLFRAIVFLASGCATASGQVQTDAGPVRGATSDGITAFLGIPFAAPPVGNLRWKPPQPVAPWTDVRDCTRFGPACPQPPGLFARGLGPQSEDCLYLNVWTPLVPPASSRHPDSSDTAPAPRPLPVMVWIHGGGCRTGAGSLPFYNGVKLARKGVVVVTINYRLGPLGFLAHPLLSRESPKGVSGNYGFLDQVAALKWVQRNIAAFGGDPTCVTIFGESAGAVSVCRHMVSPLSKGLFHRAIAQSGGAHGRNRDLRRAVGRMEAAEDVGLQLAAKLGCDKADDPLAALRAKTPRELITAADPAVGLFGKGIRFGPIVDGWALPEDPVKAFAEARQHDVPFMVGSNADEGTIFLTALPVRRPAGYRRLIKALYGDHADDVLKLFPVPRTADGVKATANRLITASAFAAPARFLVRSMERKASKAYLYHFTRKSPQLATRRYGAFHGLEIGYIFRNTRGLAWYAREDKSLSDAMRGYWTRFAATGDPNGGGEPAWPAYTTTSDQYMELGGSIRARSGLLKEACDLFDRISTEGRLAID